MPGDRYSYDAFGNLAARTGVTGNVYLYGGEHWDLNVGTYYLRARWMKPGLARFLTKDKFQGRSGEPLTLNKYAYALPNPVGYHDPSGQMSLAELSVTQAVLGIVAVNSWNALPGLYRKARGQSFIPDAAIVGIQFAFGGAVNLTGSGLALRQPSDLLTPAGRLYLQTFVPEIGVFGYQIIDTFATTPMLATFGAGAYAGIELVAHVPSNATYGVLYAGGFAGAGLGVPGGTVTIYSGVAWDVASIDKYSQRGLSYTVRPFIEGPTVTYGSGFYSVGFTFFAGTPGDFATVNYGALQSQAISTDVDPKAIYLLAPQPYKYFLYR